MTEGKMMANKRRGGRATSRRQVERGERKPTPLRPNRGSRKKPKPRNAKDPAYLAWIRTQPCPCCLSMAVEGLPFMQFSPTEAAHTGVRGLGQKPSDREAIALCGHHHRIGRSSQHELGKKFWQHWGIDRDAEISKLNERYEKEKRA